jgi:hypothetical protein
VLLGGIAKVIVQTEFLFAKSGLIIKIVQLFMNACPSKLQGFHIVTFSLMKQSIMRVIARISTMRECRDTIPVR